MSEQMSHEEAVQALEAAVASEAADEQAPDPFTTPSAPTGDTESPAPVQPQQPVAPEVAPPAAEATEDTFDGGMFNPDALPPELQSGWKQLQAAYTKKTQELAEQRRQFEALGDPESLQQAADLYNKLADPASWPQLHAELSQAMQAYGMTQVEADQAAAQAMQEQIQQPPAGPDLSGLESDPELAPLAQHLQSLQARLDQFEQQAAQEREVMEAEQMHAAMVGELTRQETAIRQARPDYQDQDIDAIYQLSSFFNGNLIEAQHRYEDIVSQRMERYFNSKQAAASDQSVQPPSGAEVMSTQDNAPETLEEATEWAIEHLRNLQAQGEDLGI